MRKLLMSVVIILVVVIGGGWYAKNLITNKVADAVMIQVDNPAVQRQISGLLIKAKANPDLINQALSDALKGSGAMGSSGIDMGLVAGVLPQDALKGTEQLNLYTKADAIRFAMSRFSPTQIARLMQLYAERNQLTGAQKKEIEREVLSHFTAKEIQAMLSVAA